jgi:hypothetical protein
MKKTISTILFMALTVALMAQKPTSGTVMGERVPLYCGSTGSSTADSTRLPIIFQAKIMGLTPGASYKYYARFISLSDTASSTTTGTGIPLIMKKNGAWYTIPSPDLSTAGGHDTLVLNIGVGEYLGWFGAIYTNDARFTPGSYIYPLIVFEEITAGGSTNKVYLLDSIKVLGFANTAGANNGTAIYGSSFVKSKSAVVLYDDVNGMPNRPIATAYSENDGVSLSNMASWYNSKVNASNGSWGAIIPNSLSNGIKRIESRDMFQDSLIYAHVENDATWGNDSTINQKGGFRPIVIKSDYAPLVKPEFEFISNTTNLVESTTVVNMLVRRRYGNADSSKVSAFVTAGTATNNVDYTILTKFPMVFKPYGEAIDTIKVRVIDDFSSEATENAAIRLNNPVNAKIGFQTTHSINITDNDIPLVTFGQKVIIAKENSGIIKVRLKINSGSTTPTSVKVMVKQKTDSTFIPGDFKLGSSNTDTTVQFPGGNVVDSFDFNISLVNDLNSEDRNDTVILALRNLTSPAKTGADSLLTIIIQDDDAPPIYRFSKSAMTVKENVGSINLRIDKIGGNVNPSDIILTYDPDGKNALPPVDFTFSTQLLQFFVNDPDSLIYNVPIINDNLSEPREDAVFIIRASFNAKMGKPDTLRVTIQDDDLPEYKIGKVITSKAPALIPDSLNVMCSLRGVVYGVNLGPVGSTQGLTFTLMDNTGGIQVYKGSGGTKGYTVTEGDSIQVYGKIGHMNGMTQITQLDTIIKFASGRPLKTPAIGAVLNEATESNLVRFALVKLARPAQWPSTALAANTSVTVKVLTQSDSFDMVIDSETDIDGKAAPTGFMNITGIGGQNDPSSPHNSGYFLAPRRFSDLQQLAVPVFGFTTDTSKAVEKRDSTEGFVLQCANLTSNQQINLVIKGGNAGRNVDYQSNANRLFILYPSAPSVIVKSKLNDDALVEGVTPETIVWVIRDNAWGTIIGPDSIHVVQIIDDESVGIELIELTAKTKLYPNPSTANGEVTVSTEAVISSITIMDINGKAIKTITDINASETRLDVEGLSKGIYSVSVMTDKGKIVKQLSIL